MTRKHLARLLVLLALLLNVASAGDVWTIRDDSVGPVKIGMTLAQLRTTLHQKLPKEDSGSDNCFYVSASGHDHVGFMMIDDHLARIDVDAPGIFTATGLQVGDSEAKVRKVYGAKLQVTAHQYIDTGHYLTVRSDDRRYGVRFETDSGKITTFYAGTYEAIQYVEGCL